ncbi:MAG: hypothetical protein R3C42_09800, partial [Parvularculaceae bacterium]
MFARLLLIPPLMLALAGAAEARIDVPYDAPATVCPAGAGAAPNFSGADCRDIAATDIDPQGADIWVRIRFDAEAEALPAAQPAGLFVSAKASSAAWLNG